MDLYGYDKYIVSFSGGKDSTALLLFLLDNGIPKDRIELWHQDIDGKGRTLFDWEVTPDYCRKLGEAFGVPVFFQWKVGGFEREMLREDSLTAPICYELPDGSVQRVGGTKGKPSTRRKFPQASPDQRRVSNVQVTPSWSRIRPISETEGNHVILTASVLSATGRNSRFGIYSKNTVSVPIRVTSWVLGDAPVSSVCSAIAINLPRLPVSATDRQMS